jgi:ParB family chromosome partitioning protein
MRNRELSMGHARTLLAIDHIETQLSLSEKIVRRKLSVRDLERIVQNFKKKQFSNVTPNEKASNIHLDNIEKAISRKFSTKVTIKKNIIGSGRIELHFYSQEQLMRLLDVLGVSEELT